ncbi:MAG: hypothetical protein R3B99_16545 [Polyangiales bacterium]
MSWTLLVVANPTNADALVRAKPEDPRWTWRWIDQKAEGRCPTR